MDVALPNGQTAQFRDVLLRGDIREAKRGMVFITSPDGSRRTDGALLEDLTGRVIARMLVGWSLDLPRPSEAAGEHLQQQILDRLDSDTYAALETAVAPWVQRILTMNRTTYTFTHNGTGETFDVMDEQQAQRLAASPDFTAVEAPGAGPKSLPTGTGSSASPAPDGQTLTE